jgi:hypothetical protein
MLKSIKQKFVCAALKFLVTLRVQKSAPFIIVDMGMVELCVKVSLETACFCQKVFQGREVFKTKKIVTFICF